MVNPRFDSGDLKGSGGDEDYCVWACPYWVEGLAFPIFDSDLVTWKVGMDGVPNEIRILSSRCECRPIRIFPGAIS